jgi:hypothetical protein
MMLLEGRREEEREREHKKYASAASAHSNNKQVSSKQVKKWLNLISVQWVFCV